MHCDRCYGKAMRKWSAADRDAAFGFAAWDGVFDPLLNLGGISFKGNGGDSAFVKPFGSARTAHEMSNFLAKVPPRGGRDLAVDGLPRGRRVHPELTGLHRTFAPFGALTRVRCVITNSNASSSVGVGAITTGAGLVSFADPGAAARARAALDGKALSVRPATADSFPPLPAAEQVELIKASQKRDVWR